MKKRVILAGMVLGLALASSTAAFAANWSNTNGEWSMIGEDGQKLTGWQSDNDNWYYFDEYGVMQTGFIKVGRDMYYLNADGTMAKGFVNANGLQYSCDPVTGILIRNKTFPGIKYDIDGVIYFYNKETKLWEYLPDDETRKTVMLETLRDAYVEGTEHYSAADFEAAVRTNVGKYMTEEEIMDFIWKADREKSDLDSWKERENSSSDYDYDYEYEYDDYDED